MTLIELLGFPFITIIVLLLICSIWFKKLFLAAIPVAMIISFGVTTFVPNFMGYAVEQRYTPPDEEFTLFKVTSDQDWIYFYVQGSLDHQPRLIKIPNTPDNKKKADELEKKAEKGLTMMKFGRQPQGKSGPDARSGDSQDMSPQTLNIPDSKTYGKTAES